MSTPADLPRALPTLLRTLRRAYRAEPGMAALSLVVTLLATAPGALIAIWLMLLVDGFIQHRPVPVWAGAAGVAASCVAIWLLRLVSGRVLRQFRMRIGVALETHVAQLQASVETIEHQERPDHLDRLSVLRDAVCQL